MTPRKRRREDAHDSSSESSEDESASDVDVDSGDDDEDHGGAPLKRTVTLEGEWEVDFIVEGPRMDDGMYRVRWGGFGSEDDTWGPTDHLSPDLVAEYNESQNSR
jgi:hypothetical protein